MITVKQLLTDVTGAVFSEEEISRTLTNRELEERLYELTQIFIDYIKADECISSKEISTKVQLLDKLTKIQEDFAQK